MQINAPMSSVSELFEDNPVVPTSHETKFSALLDLLPLHPKLVAAWVANKVSTLDAPRRKHCGVVTEGLVDSLNLFRGRLFAKAYFSRLC